jgi:plastocyanin
MRTLVTAVALMAVACGGSDTGGGDTPQPPPPVQAAPAPVAPATTGTVHDVRMVGTPDGRFAFEPAQMTIVVGDRVRWINVSGGPHNVAFDAGNIPAGAKALLNAGMSGKMGDLTGKLLVEPNATYEISFAGLPLGKYEYYCTPHQLLGMTGTITVTR